MVSNPEFLKEGAAVEDFMRPDRIVVGADDERAVLLMRALYAPFIAQPRPPAGDGHASAEFTKYAANSMLATRISFMNELALLADKVGADIELVRKGIGSDPRIGYHFLYAGTGYGGSCFPKDVKALIAHRRGKDGVELKVLKAVEAANERQKHVLVDKVVARFGDRPAPAGTSRSGAWPSSPTPTTCATRPAAWSSTSCRAAAPRSGPTTRWP